MNRKIQIEVPYPIGSQLVRFEFGDGHIDQIHQYIIKEEGTFAILILDVGTKPRLSSEISIAKLKKEWRESGEEELHLPNYNAPRGPMGISADVINQNFELPNLDTDEWYEPKSTVVDDLDGYGKQKRLDR